MEGRAGVTHPLSQGEARPETLEISNELYLKGESDN
jgi:hypothetical protein